MSIGSIVVISDEGNEYYREYLQTEFCIVDIDYIDGESMYTLEYINSYDTVPILFYEWELEEI